MPALKASNTALIFFSRSTSREAAARQRTATRYAERQLTAELERRSYRAALNSGLPVFHFHEGNQQGRTFGERLAHAFAAVFAQGFRSAISVGNDCPDLHHTDWQEVREALNQGQCVLGPDFRGGAYLIGLTAAAFDAQSFAALPWQQKGLFAALQSYSSRARHPALVLTARRDFNHRRDLAAYLAQEDVAPDLRRLLVAWLQPGACSWRFASLHPFHPASPDLDAKGLRGPPA